MHNMATPSWPTLPVLKHFTTANAALLLLIVTWDSRLTPSDGVSQVVLAEENASLTRGHARMNVIRTNSQQRIRKSLEALERVTGGCPKGKYLIFATAQQKQRQGMLCQQGVGFCKLDELSQLLEQHLAGVVLQLNTWHGGRDRNRPRLPTQHALLRRPEPRRSTRRASNPRGSMEGSGSREDRADQQGLAGLKTNGVL